MPKPCRLFKPWMLLGVLVSISAMASDLDSQLIQLTEFEFAQEAFVHSQMRDEKRFSSEYPANWRTVRVPYGSQVPEILTYLRRFQRIIPVEQSAVLFYPSGAVGFVKARMYMDYVPGQSPVHNECLHQVFQYYPACISVQIEHVRNRTTLARERESVANCVYGHAVELVAQCCPPEAANLPERVAATQTNIQRDVEKRLLDPQKFPPQGLLTEAEYAALSSESKWSFINNFKAYRRDIAHPEACRQARATWANAKVTGSADTAAPATTQTVTQTN